MSNSFTILAMVSGFLLVALIVGYRTRIIDTLHVLRRGKNARDLFLKMRIITRQGNGSQTLGEASNTGTDAYLRYIDRQEADFVSTINPNKGQSVALVLGALPAFPVSNLELPARVVKVRPLGGNPAQFHTVVRFEKRLPLNNLFSVTSIASSLRVAYIRNRRIHDEAPRNTPGH